MDEINDHTPLLQQAFSDFGEHLEDVYCSTEKPNLKVQEKCQSKSLSIISVFVVAFDIKAGNVLEWSVPNDYNLNGVEFKAMASGSHRVQTDFIYFKWDQLYGIACFENMSVDIEEERGARMKSVGIISTSYFSLHQHKPFLKDQVRFLLEHHGCYNGLTDYYETNKGILKTSNDNISINSCRNIGLAISVPLMEINHPANCFSQFMNFFEDKIFALWKIALLKKRILFFSSPPIGVACHRVYSTNCLAAHSIKDIRSSITHPLFYVNIADIEILEDEVSYVACTTEKIFESKTYLYDLYVDNQNLKTSNQMLKKLLVTNNADKKKYRELCKLRLQNSSSIYEGDISINEEVWFVRYFISLNNLLFGTLLDVSTSLNKLWTRDHMKVVGLDPVADYQFLSELLELYGINITISFGFPCCPLLQSCCN